MRPILHALAIVLLFSHFSALCSGTCTEPLPFVPEAWRVFSGLPTFSGGVATLECVNGTYTSFELRRSDLTFDSSSFGGISYSGNVKPSNFFLVRCCTDGPTPAKRSLCRTRSPLVDQLTLFSQLHCAPFVLLCFAQTQLALTHHSLTLSNFSAQRVSTPKSWTCMTPICSSSALRPRTLSRTDSRFF